MFLQIRLVSQGRGGGGGLACLNLSSFLLELQSLAAAEESSQIPVPFSVAGSCQLVSEPRRRSCFTATKAASCGRVAAAAAAARAQLLSAAAGFLNQT